MNRTASHTPRLGMDVLIEQLLSAHDAVVLRASALSKGFAAPPSLEDARVDRVRDVAQAVRRASGRQWGGQTTALILEGARLPEAVAPLVAARDHRQPVTALMWPDAVDLAALLRAALDAELTVLAARSFQHALDLAAAASFIAADTQAPCLVIGSATEGPWSLGRFEPVAVAESEPLRPLRDRTLDPSHPLGLARPMDSLFRMKQEAGRIASEPDVAGIVSSALERVGNATQRPLKSVEASGTGNTHLVFPACMAPSQDCLQSSSSASLVMTQLFPSPPDLERDGHVAVVLPAGRGSDALHPIERAFEGRPTPSRRRGFLRRTSEEATHKGPLTVLADPLTDWTQAHVEAIAAAASAPSRVSDIRTLDARLAADTRVPAIEEAVHASRNLGFDPSAIDVPVGDDVVSQGLWIGARHPHDALDLAHRMLDRAEAGAVASPRMSEHGGDSLVWIRIKGVDGMPTPVVLLPDPLLLEHRSLRHLLPAGARIFVPATQAGLLPAWLSDHGRSVSLVADEADWTSLSSVDTASSTRDAKPDDFMAAGQIPPEEWRLPSGADYSPRTDFLRTLGHLQDLDRIDEAPVDEWILTGSTPAMTPRPNRWANDPRPLPHVIGERCTGCASCWTVCPERAITARTFTIEELLSSLMAEHGGAFVHLPRLLNPWIQTAHQVLRKDDLGQFRNAALLLNESLDRLLESAGVADAKAEGIRAEAGQLTAHVSHQDLIRTTTWFDAAESNTAGSGQLLALRTDPTTCTHCGLCLQACGDHAVEEVLSNAHVDAFRELDTLPAFSTEGIATPVDGDDSRTVPAGSLLTGPSSVAAFRSGSTDRGNLNRTVLRLQVEAHANATRSRHEALKQALDAARQGLESAMQQSAVERLRINDFAAFDQQLESAAGDVSGVLRDLLASHASGKDTDQDDLSIMADLHRVLAEISDQVTLTGAGMLVVDSLASRQAGLAPFPSNPFGVGSLALDHQAASDAIPGLIESWKDRLTTWAGLIRRARQLADGTFDGSTLVGATDEDHTWAQEHLPRVLWLVDHLESRDLDILRSGHPVHICWLDGGPSLDPDPTLRGNDVTALLPDISFTSDTPEDPTALLDKLLHLSRQNQGVAHIVAPDGNRDGVEIDDLPFVLQRAREAGLTDGSALTASLADWMVLQQRFQAHFTPLDRSDFSSDQIPVVDWLKQETSERSRFEPVVFLGTGKDERRWMPDAAVLDRSRSWWESANVGRKTALDAMTDSVEPSREEPESTVKADSDGESSRPDATDAHAQLTDRLLALSGFEHGGTSLRAWLDARLQAVADDDAGVNGQTDTGEQDA